MNFEGAVTELSHYCPRAPRSSLRNLPYFPWHKQAGLQGAEELIPREETAWNIRTWVHLSSWSREDDVILQLWSLLLPPTSRGLRSGQTSPPPTPQQHQALSLMFVIANSRGQKWPLLPGSICLSLITREGRHLSTLTVSLINFFHSYVEKGC